MSSRGAYLNSCIARYVKIGNWSCGTNRVSLQWALIRNSSCIEWYPAWLLRQGLIWGFNIRSARCSWAESTTYVFISACATVPVFGLQNAVSSWLENKGVCFQPTDMETKGKCLLSTLADALWLIDRHFETIADRSYAIPTEFSGFSGYNVPEASRQVKNAGAHCCWSQRTQIVWDAGCLKGDILWFMSQ